MRKSKQGDGAQPPDKGSKSSPIHTTALRGLPKTEIGAAQLLRNLGYKDVIVSGVELDRIYAIIKGRALTFLFDFDHQEENVHIFEVAGWPVD